MSLVFVCAALWAVWAQANREDLKLAIADIGSNEQVSEDWISSTPFFLSRFPAVRRGKPRMLSERYQKDGPEHQVLQYLQYSSLAKPSGNSYLPRVQRSFSALSRWQGCCCRILSGISRILEMGI
ncbi:hypothetical protein ABN584_10585 [Gloeocapsa sp. BRSZ]